MNKLPYGYVTFKGIVMNNYLVNYYNELTEQIESFNNPPEYLLNARHRIINELANLSIK